MRAFFLLVLTFAATSQASRLPAKPLGWNSFLDAGSIFPAELNHVDFDTQSEGGNADSTAQIQQQLTSLLDKPGHLEQIYKNYLIQFNKFEEPLPIGAGTTRLALFRAKLLDIAEFNTAARAGKHSWTKAVTRFSDVTAEELPASSNPMLISKMLNVTRFEDLEDFALLSKLVTGGTKDYRDDGIVSPVKDQGLGCKGGGGACYSFAAAAAAESRYARDNGGKILDLAEYEIISCGADFDKEGLLGCNGGDTYRSLIFMKNGLALESDFPAFTGSKSGEMPCPADVSSKTHYAKVTGKNRLPENNEDKLEALLLARGPIMVGVGVDLPDTTGTREWFDYGPNSGVYDGKCGPSENHSVLCVGFTEDAWIIKNSWATTWGEAGYIRLKRGVNKCGVGDTLTFIKELA